MSLGSFIVTCKSNIKDNDFIRIVIVVNEYRIEINKLRLSCTKPSSAKASYSLAYDEATFYTPLCLFKLNISFPDGWGWMVVRLGLA